MLIRGSVVSIAQRSLWPVSFNPSNGASSAFAMARRSSNPFITESFFAVAAIGRSARPARFGFLPWNHRPDSAPPRRAADRPPGVAHHAVGTACGDRPGPASGAPRLGSLRGAVRREDPGHGLAGSLGAQEEFGAEAGPGCGRGLDRRPFFGSSGVLMRARSCCQGNAGSNPLRRAGRRRFGSPPATRSHTPTSCQRRKREYDGFQGPKHAGRSRQGTPMAKRQRMALTMSRCGWFGRPGGGQLRGKMRLNRRPLVVGEVMSCVHANNDTIFANTPR